MSTLLETWIDEDFGIEGRGNWYHSSEHDSLVLDKSKNTWYWNSRGIAGNELDYLVKVRGFSKLDAEKFLKDFNKVANPVLKKHKMNDTPYEKLVDVAWEKGKNNRAYWYHRLLSDDTIDRYRLGFYNGWYTVPLYEDGIFLNFQIRRDEPKKHIRYWYDNDDFSPVLINSEILKFVDYVYITEGTIDAILLNQLGYPAVAQTGGNFYWNPEWNFLFQKVKDIIYVMDNDGAGTIHAKRVSNNLGLYRVRVVVLGEEKGFDTVEFFRRGNSTSMFDTICSSNFKYSFQLDGARK